MCRNSVLLVIVALSVTIRLVKPRRCLENEDCYETQMHPDLRVEPYINKFPNGSDSADFWLENGKSFVLNQVRLKPNTRWAKNVILFLGDGMGLTTVAATRVYMENETDQLEFEKFPYTGLSKTYSVDKIVPDSASTATSYLCGVKANYGTIGVNANIERGNCVTAKNTTNHVNSIAKWSLDAGKSGGFVTTTRVTHASPAGLYAHTADRGWENDLEVRADCGKGSGIDDIATQLIYGNVGSRLKVILGGGRREFLSSSNGKRSDGKNLIREFKNQSPYNAYVETRKELMNLNVNSVDRLLGLFQNSHMKYHLEAIEDRLDQPTLEEMTRRAIQLLQNDTNGYFLFVEGGRIDIAHHGNKAKLALDETKEFSKAIKTAREMTSTDDTLIVVTADHSHAFSFSGYPARNRQITGTAGVADDDLPYMTMSYANGPSFKKYYDKRKGRRIDPTSRKSKKKNQVHAIWPATVPLDSETHGGEDVGVYASGPWAHLFTGVYEQNAIPHMLAYASCVGEGLKMCRNPKLNARI